jgi:hypothetical protein
VCSRGLSGRLRRSTGGGRCTPWTLWARIRARTAILICLAAKTSN